MVTAGSHPIRVVEHILPPALQTHEVCFIPSAGDGHQGGHVLITQMEEGRLIKIPLDEENGELPSQLDFATFSPEGTEGIEGRGDLPFVGLHGLSPSSKKGKAWITLQYINQICLVDVETLAVEVSIACPSALEDGRGPIGGPHTAVEKNGHLYVCMKGGASCHGEPADAEAEEANAHALWRVALTDELRAKDAGTVFESPATPVMCAVTDDGDCWVACDASPTLFHVPVDAHDNANCVYHQLPYHYAQLKQTGPGIVMGPDGRPWFCILNGDGLIGRVSCCGKLQIFELLKTFNRKQKLCHLSWDREGVLYAISSDLLDKEALNTLIRIKFDESYTHVVAQHEIAFPSQHTCVHRVLHLDDACEPSVLVSELSTSQCLQIFKKGLPPLDQFPTKTFDVSVKRVYNAYDPCPRSGNPMCHCTGANGATIPRENIWADESADEVFDPEKTPTITDMEEVVDPRTGEELLLHDFTTGTKGDHAFSKFWAYGIKGFKPDQVPMANLYSSNGNPNTPSEARSGMIGATSDVLRFKPGYLKAVLQREPWRKAQLLEELRAAGLEACDFPDDKC